MESAIIAQKRADRILIDADQDCQDFAHRFTSSRHCLSRDVRSCLLSALSQPARANTTISKPPMLP